MSTVVRDRMQGAMDLSVPLKVEVNTGADWMAAK